MSWDAGDSIAPFKGTPESFTTTTTTNTTTTTTTDTTTGTTTTTVVGPANFPAANLDTTIFFDALPLKCSPAAVNGPNPSPGNAVLIGCADPAHVNPPHVHGAHTHGATSTSTSASTSTTTKKAAVPDRPGGSRRDVYVADWTPAGGSFVQFAGSARVNPNATAGFQVVLAISDGGRSHQVSQFDDDAGGTPVNGDSTIVLTLANWFIDHKSLGRVTVGRVNTPTAGLSTIDLGGAGVAANASIGYWQRGFAVTGAGGGSSSPAVGASCSGAMRSTERA